MANRRMFSKDIVRSDEFLDLSATAQLLYFHLGMEADDRGYVNNVKSIIRLIGTSYCDLEQLVNKKFVLLREGSLVLIKGWRINNSIQPSRIVETKHLEDLKKLYFDENHSYTEHETSTPCISHAHAQAEGSSNTITDEELDNYLSSLDKNSKD